MGNLKAMTTTYIPKMSQFERKWYLIDAQDLVLGKLAAAAAQILSGKNKPVYTPFLDTGDHVVVVNASKVAVSGTKESTKLYHRHSGYLGGLRSRPSVTPQEVPDARHRGSDPRHAPEDEARPSHVSQAQGLRRRQPPASGAEARADRREEEVRRRHH